MRIRVMRLHYLVFIVLSLVYLVAPQANAVTLNGFDVIYGGRVYDSDEDTTTYTYLVQGNGEGPGLGYFVVGLPDCDFDLMVISYVPDNAVEFGIDPKTGIDGIKWELELAPDASSIYSFTLLGEYGEELTDVALKAGRFRDVGQAMGPSCDVDPPEPHSISGVVFFDNNLNGIPDEGSYIKNVRMYLYDSDNVLIGIYLTEIDGYYSFIDLLPGSYTVEFPGITPENDFNEILFWYFYKTTPMVYNIELSDADSTDNNFGFAYVRPSSVGVFDSPSRMRISEPVAATQE